MTTIYCIRPEGFNVGNDVIFLAMRRFLYEAFGRVVNLISLPATSRYESHAKAGLNAKTIHEINQYGDGVIIGGGNLYENGELEIDFNALETLEVPLMLFSISHGRIYNKNLNLVRRTDAMPKKKVYEVNKFAQISLARDLATLGYLHELGATDAKLGGCPTLFIDQTNYSPPALTVEDQGTTYISIRTPDLMNIPIVHRKRVSQSLEKICAFLKASGHDSVKLLCHDHRDIPFAASLEGIEYVYTGDVHSFLALLKGARLCISFRLHATLPCLSFGTPVVNVSYDERALSMMKTIGLEDWNIDLTKEVDLDDAVKQKVSSIDSLETVKQSVAGTWSELRSTMRNHFMEFVSLIEDNG